MEPEYASPNSDVSVQKPRPWFKWIAWGCFGSVVILILLFGSCFLAIKNSMKAGSNEFGSACAQYLEKYEANDFSGAYALMGDQAKKEFTAEKHNAIMAGIKNKLGSIKSMDVQFVQTGINQHGKWGRIIYRTEFEHGTGAIRFELMKISNEYQVVGVFFESPVLTEYLNNVLSQNP